MSKQGISKVTVSVVLYKNEPEVIKELCKSLLPSRALMDIHFIDNSPTNILKRSIETILDCQYTWTGKNIGFGRGHNSVIEKHLDSGQYHLVLNPDVYYDEGTMEKIVSYMDRHVDIGLLLPRVLNPDGSEQPLYKLLPKPQDLLFRRFLPEIVKKNIKTQLNKYNMSFADERTSFDAPYLSGCFMFMRKEALMEVGVFDTNFFLYCEDIDLSRRIRRKWRTTYFPNTFIYHHFYKGSYKKLKLLYHHVVSAIKYFNKHGWLIDPERDQFNEETLGRFKLLENESIEYCTK
ncbi:glycosyltransferase [Roseivirga sp. E12]|uniref:glycosyltransferase n=1 Tax=Roseivirga sp. E12 TaxID=2819237 RepID=UPI001ABC0402|nr:glycosyltransferase [Roseivirga sp. E12]MBO3699316.1 glycosyltransferase [Roseivirga sp. E12]